MSKRSLIELLDLALRTPGIGGVNFTALHLLLGTMLKESRLAKQTVHYEGIDPNVLMRKILQGEKEKPLPNLEVIDESQEKLYINEKIKDEESAEAVLKEERSTNTDREIWPVPELNELFESVKHLEEILDKVTQNVDSLKRQIKQTRKVRRKKKETEKVPKDTQPDVSNSSITHTPENKDELGRLDREEFEEVLEEIRDSIRQLANKLKHQEQSSIKPVDEESIQKLCEKVAGEEIAKRQEGFTNQIKGFAFTIASMQKALKEFLHPQAAAVTKCVTCGRKAELPDLDIISELPGNIRADKNSPKFFGKNFRDVSSETPGDKRSGNKLLKFVKKKTAEKMESQKKHELKFTRLALNRIKKAANQPVSKLLQQEQEQPLIVDSRIESQGNRDEEKNPVNMFNIGDATAAFMPLRYIPDPARSGALLSDAIHVNPDGMTVSLIGTPKQKHQLRFEAKSKQDENA